MPTPDKRFIVAVFEATAAKYPDHTVVDHAGRSVTYAALREHTCAIAESLHNAGVGRGVIVGSCLAPGAEYLATLLAIMKTGGIVLPLDLEFPPRRLDAILKKTTPALIVGQTSDLGRLAERVPDVKERGIGTAIMERDGSLGFDTARLGFPDPPAGPPQDLSPDDGCYLMYTSGSTGEPKAILGCHKSLSHFMHWEAREFELDDTLRVSQFAPLTFDASLRDLLLPLVVGGRVCIPDDEDRTNPRRLVNWLDQQQVNLVHCVPSFFRVLTAEAERSAQQAPLTHLRRILMAGEALHGKDVLRWMDVAGDRVELVNLYGCSETTLIKTFHRITERPASPASIIPVGRPIANTAVLIIRNGRLSEIGEIGDIYINTPFASKGYYQDPEATAAGFVPNPLDPESGQTVYRTGDMGRYLPDRSIEFIGRLDSQVKLNGIRVELGEVERAVNALENVEQAVIVALSGPHNEKSLACYYTLAGAVTTEAMRRQLSDILPDYMVPAFFVQLDELPLNINGKVDRKALPKPEEVLYQQVSYEAPAHDDEGKVASIWADVLGLDKVGVNNPFGELGGHSLQAIRIISRIYRAFGVEMSIRAFFDHPTVRKQAELLRQQTPTTYEKIPALPEMPCYPLSQAQRRLWVLGQIDGGLDAYKNTHAAIIEGPLDVAALRQALAAVQQRHESLRTVYVTESGQPMQKVLDDVAVPLEESVLEDGRPEAIRTHLDEEKLRPMDLERGPAFRARLILLPQQPEHETPRHVLIVTMHHIISDGWSMGVFENDLFALYEAFCTGGESPLPEPAIQYRDYAAWQNKRLDSEALAADRDYWVGQLAGDNHGLDLLTDYPRPAAFSYRGETRHFRLGPTRADALRQLAKQENATIFMVLVAAIKVLLYRYTGQTDLSLGSPVAGRSHADLEGQIGFFAQTLVLRDVLAEGDAFRAVVRQVRQTCLDAFDHGEYPFDHLVDALEIQRDPSRNPLFDVMVVLQESGETSRSVGPLTITELEVEESFSRFDLTFNFHEAADGLNVDINFATDLFDPLRIERMAAHLETLLDSIVREPDTAIADLTILPPQELDEILTLSRGPVVRSAEYASIIDAFEAQVDRTPDRPALITPEGDISYRELYGRAERVAGFLRAECGVATGDCVGSMVPRGPWNIVALLGIMKSGATYLPIDPDHPPSRIAHVLEDSGCAVALTDGRTQPSITENASVSLVAIAEACREGMAIVEDVSRVSAPAYVIYTSGSTGRPKGVAVGHAAFLNMAMAQIEGFGVTPEDRVLQFFSPAFDGALSEVFMALLAGAALVPVAADVAMEENRFRAFVQEHRVTVASLTPSFLSRLKRSGLEGLRALITAGEPAVVDEALSYGRHLRYFNAYGPTESAVCATFHEIRQASGLRHGTLPVGRPIANMAVYVLDDALRPVPRGVPGEICLAGVGLASGYLNQPRLTAQRFVPSPFDGGRLYRTGDLGRWVASGELEFLGRIDTQVKIRGHRIECEEVEHWILQHRGIDTAVAVARDVESHGAQLVAYFVADHPVDVAELRSTLRAQLPEYMMPSRFVQLERMPLAPTGKIDRQALPSPTASRPKQVRGPRDEVEHKLAEIWSEILGREVGVDENFFEIGGHSLRAMEAVTALEDRFSIETRIVDFYQSPTIRELAQTVKSRTRRSADRPPCLRFNPDSSLQIFAFPAVADADSLIYAAVARRLPDACIHAFRFVERSDLVEYYAGQVSELHSGAPCVLLGYSAGGNIAFRVAAELEKRGKDVSDVILLDSGWRGQLEPLTQHELARYTDLHLAHHPFALERNGHSEREMVRQHLKEYIAWLSQSRDTGVIAARIHLIRATDNADSQAASAWKGATTSEFQDYRGAGTHYHMLSEDAIDENVRIVGRILRSVAIVENAADIDSGMSVSRP